MKKKQAEKTRPRTGRFTVTEKEYRKQLAAGLSDGDVLRPGSYKYRRGSFAELHGSSEGELRESFKRHNIKVGVYMKLDLDVLDFFKARAAQPGGLPYQNQINAELRNIMEASKADVRVDDLVSNEKVHPGRS